jgi:alkaline phosphatase
MYMYGSGLPFAIDASEREEHPRLAEVLEKSITMLDGPGGFFIMCEGGKIDYAGHGNDAAASIRETIDLDRAVKVALAFRERNPGETLIIVTGDHETGGLSLGFAGTGGHFDVELLGLQKTSVENFSSKIKRRIRKSKGEISFNEVKPDLEREFGFCFPGDAPKKNQRRVMLTENDLKVLEAAFAKDVENVRIRLQDTTAHDVTRRYVFAQTVKNVLNAHAGVAWSTFSHTAQPTLTTAIGAGAEIVDGMTENVDISNRLRELLSK